MITWTPGMDADDWRESVLAQATPLRCESVTAMEDCSARLEVREFANETYTEQYAAWKGNKEANRRNKARPPTYDECFAMSRRVRLKREARSNYWNQLTSKNPIH